MKKLISLFLVAVMLTSCICAAFAEDSTYYSESLEAEIVLPAGLYVKGEEEYDDGVLITIGMEGRTDVGFGIRYSYYEDYEDFCTNNMPDDIFQQICDYYNSTLDCSKNAAPAVQDWSDGDPDYEDLNPLMVCGVNENGELMLYYELIYYGWDILVYGGIAGDDFDEESAYAAYQLFFNALDVMMSEEE